MKAWSQKDLERRWTPWKVGVGLFLLYGAMSRWGMVSSGFVLSFALLWITMLWLSQGGKRSEPPSIYEVRKRYREGVLLFAGLWAGSWLALMLTAQLTGQSVEEALVLSSFTLALGEGVVSVMLPLEGERGRGHSRSVLIGLVVLSMVGIFLLDQLGSSTFGQLIRLTAYPPLLYSCPLLGGVGLWISYEIAAIGGRQQGGDQNKGGDS